MFPSLPASWQLALGSEFQKPYWESLISFIKSEYGQQVCFPKEKNIFKAFDMTHFDNVRVVILGQDPYHTAYVPVIPGLTRDPGNNNESSKMTGFLPSQEGQKQQKQPEPQQSVCAAMGLSFSIPEGSKPQPSLRNIFKELASDIGIQRTRTDLTDWAEQGVLLLNTVLTVREGDPASHQQMGWENFTDAAIIALSAKRVGIVFILWGNSAITKESLIDTTKHHIITSPHPSPFSAYRGFFGSRPFSRTNAYLREQGSEEIIWG